MKGVTRKKGTGEQGAVSRFDDNVHACLWGFVCVAACFRLGFYPTSEQENNSEMVNPTMSTSTIQKKRGGKIKKNDGGTTNKQAGMSVNGVCRTQNKHGEHGIMAQCGPIILAFCLHMPLCHALISVEQQNTKIIQRSIETQKGKGERKKR